MYTPQHLQEYTYEIIMQTHEHTHTYQYFKKKINTKKRTHLKNGTILLASFSADLKPWLNNITSAMSCRSGLVMARERNSFLRLSGRLDRPA